MGVVYHPFIKMKECLQNRKSWHVATYRHATYGQYWMTSMAHEEGMVYILCSTSAKLGKLIAPFTKGNYI
jgi:hypothetical protein